MQITVKTLGLYKLSGNRRRPRDFDITIVLPSVERLEGDLLLLLFRQRYSSKLRIPLDYYYPEESRQWLPEIGEGAWKHTWQFGFKDNGRHDQDLIAALDAFEAIPALREYWLTHRKIWPTLDSIPKAAE